MDEKLQQLIDLQTEQNQLLKRYLWRIRFSLLGLLLMTTAVAIGLGFVAYHTRPQAAAPAPVAPQFRWPQPAGSSAPAGDIEVLPGTPGTT
jgi:hypothetical protein